MLDKLAGSVLLAAGFILLWREWNTPSGQIDNMLLAAGFAFMGAFVLLIVNPQEDED